MSDPQGIVTFPGIDAVISASMTLSHGIAPSVCNMKIAPQNTLPPATGTLTWIFGGTRFSFRECLIDSASLQVNASGQIVALKILDRRWKWKFGEIDGYYNRRKPDESIDVEFEKTPQQLATLLMREFAGGQFNVSRLPNFSRPEVAWEQENPANELARLCDQLGCRVVYSVDDTVQIWPAGQGNAIPNNDLVMTVGYSLDPPNIPDSIKVVGGKKRYQSRWSLEAVGLEADDSIKLIDDLSYKPSVGWEREPPFSFSNVLKEFGRDEMELAKQSVWRWYRIVDTEIDAPDRITVTRKQALPIETEKIEVYTDPQSQEKPKPAQVIGIAARKTGTKLSEGYTNSEAGDVLDEDFQIDPQEGIVKFSNPLWKWDDNQEFAEPDIELEVAYSRRNTDLTWVRLTYEEQVSPFLRNTGPEILKVDEIVQTYVASYDEDSIIQPLLSTANNRGDVIREARFHLRARKLRYQTQQAFDIQYAGLIPFILDGLRQQVTWNVGGGGATTRVSLNTESQIAIPTYDQFRDAQEQRKAAMEARREQKRRLRIERGRESP